MSVLTTTPLKVAPSAAAGVSITAGTMPSWGSWVEVIASTAAPIAIAGAQFGGGTYTTQDYELDIGVGAGGAEASVGTLRVYLPSSTASTTSGLLLPVPLGGIGSGVRVAVRARSNGGTSPATVALSYYESLSSDQVTTNTQVLSAAPAGSAAPNVTPSATPWANSAWVELLASAASNLGLLGLAHGITVGAENGAEWDLGTGGSGAETVITTLRDLQPVTARIAYSWLPGLYPITAGTRVAVRVRKAGTNTGTITVALLYYTGVSAYAGTGTGAISVGVSTTSGTGTVAAPGVTGTGDVTFGAPTLSGSGLIYVTYPTRRLRQWGLPASPQQAWVFLRQLEVLVQAGVGTTVDPGADPQIMLTMSRDGGQTWGPERSVSAGPIGQYTRRARFKALGRYRKGGACRITVSDPVPWAFLRASGELQEGTR